MLNSRKNLARTSSWLKRLSLDNRSADACSLCCLAKRPTPAPDFFIFMANLDSSCERVYKQSNPRRRRTKNQNLSIHTPATNSFIRIRREVFGAGVYWRGLDDDLALVTAKYFRKFLAFLDDVVELPWCLSVHLPEIAIIATYCFEILQA